MPTLSKTSVLQKRKYDVLSKCGIVISASCHTKGYDYDETFAGEDVISVDICQPRQSVLGGLRQSRTRISLLNILESPSQFENRIMARVYVGSITRSTVYQNAPFC